MQFQLALDSFLEALRLYIDNPSSIMALQLHHKTMGLQYTLSQEQAEMERRITENVLKRISVHLETNGAVNEIDSLKKAIDNLGK